MGFVQTDKLMPGMLLAADVQDRNGRLLLGAGVELSEKNIYIFRTWGVIEADIAGVDNDDAGNTPVNEIDPMLWAAAEEGIKPLFRHTDLSDPAMGELLRLAVLRRISHGVY